MIIPVPHLERLQKAHTIGRQAILASGYSDSQVESLQVSKTVEKHRWAWKPPTTRFVLIAESHVFTTPKDVSYRVDPTFLPQDAQHSPHEFVRLIYCLGYGESEILTPPGLKDNPGTRHFWELFAELAGKLPSKQKKSQHPLSERLNWKVETLKALQERGVWLLDASLHGIYGLKKAPGTEENRLPPKLASQLHEIWWGEYGGYIVDELEPEGIWLVGKDIVKAFQKLEVNVTGWIYQPGAQMTYHLSRESLNQLIKGIEEY
ncbi:MAG: hypothetical protein KY468_04820 [Armatimonadetes bacterium]|nr:hypothetical protein [Armatimonadota bacterium]